MTLRKRRNFLIPALILAFFTAACASKPFLKVQYQLPSPSSTLGGKQVSLTVSDMRSKETLVTETARKSLRDFKGTFSLVVLRDDGSGNLRGAYDLVSLFSEVFQQRLKNEGIQATTVTDSSLPELKIEITEFQIDFVDRKWIVGMNYQTSLLDNGNLLSKESVSGQAERLKVMGKKGAEKVLSELLTDVVNKLNLVGLFQQARL
ncbi:MAG: hypothetical protein PVH37_11745 [Desulfobacterales bacterium]|jgi:uncharacterized lipoprotein YajG